MRVTFSMKRIEILLMILKVPLDAFMLFLAALSAYYLRLSEIAQAYRPVMFDISLPEYFQVITPVVIGFLIVFAFLDLYSTDSNKKLLPELLRVFFACATVLAIIALYIFFTLHLFDSRFLVAIGFFLAVIFVSLGRILVRGLRGLFYRLNIGQRRMVIIGSGDLKDEVVRALDKRRELGYKVLRTYDHFSDSAAAQIKRLAVDEILFLNPRANEEETLSAIEFANDLHIVFKYSADLFTTYSLNMTINPLAGLPIVELKRTPLDGWGRVAKRLFDVLVSLILIIVTSPITILTSLFILIETGRPVIYKNERVGIRGKKFFTLKFRSMYQKDSTGEGYGGKSALLKEKKLIEQKSIKEGPVYKIANDPRVTPFGSFIRRWSIDELPQFFNVLKGEMSIVGPRPHQPREVAKYERQHRKVFTLKPGITGLAQISGRSDLSFEDEVKLDVFYIERWNLLLDFIIFLKTPFILFKKRKAL